MILLITTRAHLQRGQGSLSAARGAAPELLENLYFLPKDTSAGQMSIWAFSGLQYCQEFSKSGHLFASNTTNRWFRFHSSRLRWRISVMVGCSYTCKDEPFCPISRRAHCCNSCMPRQRVLERDTNSPFIPSHSGYAYLEK